MTGGMNLVLNVLSDVRGKYFAVRVLVVDTVLVRAGTRVIARAGLILLFWSLTPAVPRTNNVVRICT